MMQATNDDVRLRALIGVALLHALFGWLLVASLAPSFLHAEEERLAVFNIAPQAAPPPVSRTEPRVTRRVEGQAAQANRRAEPKAVVAPPPRVPVPQPKSLT